MMLCLVEERLQQDQPKERRQGTVALQLVLDFLCLLE
jgi:hypothetical protein